MDERQFVIHPRNDRYNLPNQFGCEVGFSRYDLQLSIMKNPF